MVIVDEMEDSYWLNNYKLLIGYCTVDEMEYSFWLLYNSITAGSLLAIVKEGFLLVAAGLMTASCLIILVSAVSDEFSTTPSEVNPP